MSLPSCPNRRNPEVCPSGRAPGKSPVDTAGGFTLIEVMTALSILALLATMTFSVVLGSSGRSRHLTSEMELRQGALMIMNLITEDLKGAFVYEGGAYFVGLDNYHGEQPADKMNLITTSHLPVNPMITAGDLAEVGYALSFDDGETTGILSRRTQVPPEIPEDNGGVAYELSRRVRSLDLRYYDGEDWMDEWDSQDVSREHTFGKLPREIEIELALGGDEGTEVILRTRISPPMAGKR